MATVDNATLRGAFDDSMMLARKVRISSFSFFSSSRLRAATSGPLFSITSPQVALTFDAVPIDARIDMVHSKAGPIAVSEADERSAVPPSAKTLPQAVDPQRPRDLSKRLP